MYIYIDSYQHVYTHTHTIQCICLKSQVIVLQSLITGIPNIHNQYIVKEETSDVEH